MLFSCAFASSFPGAERPTALKTMFSSSLSFCRLAGVPASRRGLKVAACAVSNKPTGKPRGIKRPRKVSPAMQELNGVPEISRTESLKLIYARVHQAEQSSGRAGRFVELIDHLEKMHCKADDRIWNALIGVCTIHGNSKLGKKTAEGLIELQPQSTGPYMLLSSIYATSGNWECVQKVRQLMEQQCVRKEQASISIYIQNKVLSGA